MTWRYRLGLIVADACMLKLVTRRNQRTPREAVVNFTMKAFANMTAFGEMPKSFRRR
jgi:hypothetical protein